MDEFLGKTDEDLVEEFIVLNDTLQLYFQLTGAIDDSGVKHLSHIAAEQASRGNSEVATEMFAVVESIETIQAQL